MRTHGHSSGADGRGKPTPEYAAWCSMRARCLRPSNKDFESYGGRGITICSRWGSFLNFLADMGPLPTNGYTLERIKNNRGYTPKNCKWTSRSDQAKNRRTTKRVKVGIRSILLKDAEILTGVPAKTIAERLHAGWSDKDAIQPLKGQTHRCKRGHAYADTGFYLTKLGHRVCKSCSIDNAARYKARINQENNNGPPSRS